MQLTLEQVTRTQRNVHLHINLSVLYTAVRRHFLYKETGCWLLLVLPETDEDHESCRGSILSQNLIGRDLPLAGKLAKKYHPDIRIYVREKQSEGAEGDGRREKEN